MRHDSYPTSKQEVTARPEIFDNPNENAINRSKDSPQKASSMVKSTTRIDFGGNWQKSSDIQTIYGIIS